MADHKINIQYSSSHNEWFEFIMSYRIPRKSESNRPKIQNVPQMLSRIESNKKCYEPMVVSIGPYHHGKPELSVVEERKILMTQKYIANIVGSDIGNVYHQVAMVAEEARECYEGNLKLSNEEFTQMMFLDGCFIVQFMYYTVKQERGELGMKSDIMAFVQRDLLLLENQLPYLVLKKLIIALFKDGDEGESIIHKFIDMTLATSPHPDVSFRETLCSGSVAPKVPVEGDQN